MQDYQENDNYKWAIVTKAAILYENTYHSRPTDQERLQQAVQQIVSRMPRNVQIESKYSHEACRYQGADIHTTVALMGGVAVQEGIKLLTQQGLPIQHTLIYDGVESTIAVHQF